MTEWREREGERGRAREREREGRGIKLLYQLMEKSRDKHFSNPNFNKPIS
jgi:hypothetical protein